LIPTAKPIIILEGANTMVQLELMHDMDSITKFKMAVRKPA